MAPVDRKNPPRAKSSQSLYSLREFQQDFPDDESCLVWLWRERYAPDGEHAYCPKCETARSFKRYATKQQRQSWTCTACGHHLHPTAGTIFHKSSRPLTDWFYVMFLVSSSRCGISAKQVERELGCNYKTAWRMLNLVRDRLMKQEGDKLSGTVEADESFFGGKPHAYPKVTKNSHWDRKPVIFAAVERGGRIRAQVIANTRGPLISTRVREVVMEDSFLFTDEYHAYKSLGKVAYKHRRVNHGAKIYVADDGTHTNTVEGFFGLFKTGVRGTHHAISRRWLHAYLNEWVWKWDRRNDDEAMFWQLLDSSATTR